MVWRQRRILVGVAVDGKETRQQSRVIVPRSEIGIACLTVGFFPRESWMVKWGGFVCCGGYHVLVL